MKFIFVYITCPTFISAKKITKRLLSRKTIGCANIFPVKSFYRWNKKINEDGEWVIVAKTSSAKFNAVKKEVCSEHPYKVPCITKIFIEPNKEYSAWLAGELK